MKTKYDLWHKALLASFALSPPLIFDLGNYFVNHHANKYLPPPEALIEVIWKKFVTIGVDGPNKKLWD